MKGKFCLFAVLFISILMIFTNLAAQTDSTKKKQLVIFPVIAKSIETGWAFGAAGSITFRPFKNDTVSRTSNLQVLALYSTKKQLVTAINGAQYFNKEKYILLEQISYSSFPDKFWGLGKNSPDNAEEPYQFQQFYLYAHLMRKLAPHLFVGSIFEFQKVWNIHYEPGGLFDQQNIAGRGGYQVGGLGASITFDSRNSAFSPNKGSFAQFYFNNFSPLFGTDFQYTNFVLDLRKYIRLYDNQVLAMQLYSFNNSGENIPIRSLASFGGANRMRGYYEGRYKDKQEFVIQTEYRMPIYKRIGAVVFGGVGNVNDKVSDFSLNKLKYSYGAGLRFAINKSEKLNIRIDYGIAGGINKGFYLQIGEAF
ncbi:MAG: surface antigen (D15) [Chitinophagaceae bacterium]|nr:MAG: surface antigen (D15) [Chitinophagaceae bacterium]